MHNIWSYIIVGILVFTYILALVIETLNLKALKPELPEEMKDTYDAEKYKKSQEYTRVRTRFGFIESTISLLIILSMIIFDGFAYLDRIVSGISKNNIVISLLFFGILYVANEILSLPFELHSVFGIEQKFGFNKTTKKTFWLDKIKSLLLLIIIGGGLGALLLYILQLDMKHFWIYALIVITAFSIFMSMFYSSLIVPLFNKQTPLPEGELRTAIEKFAEKAGFKLQNIYLIDGSKRSTKANAYFTGLGSKKRIVLYDTLIDMLTTDELVAVLAHELGHYKKKHIIQGLVLSTITTGIILFIFNLMLNFSQISEALGVHQIKVHIALITFAIILNPVSLIINMFTNVLSRKNEYQADNFAKTNGLGNELISSLKKLSVNNLSNLTPHKAYVFLNYSHPTLLQRISKLKQ